MRRRKQRQRRNILIALFATILVCIGGVQLIRGIEFQPNDTPATANNDIPAITANIAANTAPSKTKPVRGKKAKSADAFVDSMCVNTHWRYPDTPYGSNYEGVKQKLVALGVRHIRDGGSSEDFVAKIKELGRLGIKTTVGIDPQIGVVPNSSYWSKPPAHTINDFVKNQIGLNAVDAVEVLNEIDLFYKHDGGYRWLREDTQTLDNDPKSLLYWGKYARSMTQDTWKAIKNDPATAHLKVIGPSLASWYDYGSVNPIGDLSAYVDWGNFHPYPFNGNSYGNREPYNSIKEYYLTSNFPSQNIDEYPHAVDVYSRPFRSKPMVATETGYYTGKAEKAISESVHAKYMPRLFLEYFRKGIVRTCSYEFVDEWQDSDNKEANFGLLRNNLSPKPAYTALKNLISLLKDPGSSYTTGALDYTLTIKPPKGYNRKQYVHDLLLQKRDGSFYLALWHEISNYDLKSEPPREIKPPAMPTTLNLKTPIKSATVYYLSDSGNISSKATKIIKNKLSLNVTDKAMVVKLTPAK